MSGQDWLEKDFYKTLGVAKDADQTAIKKAYRKLARQYHPDQNPGDEKAETKFKEIGEAYAVLSDEEQRKQYDAIRAMGGGARFSAGGPGSAGFTDAFSSMFGGQGTSFNFSTSGSGVNIEDLLGMFGGAAGGFNAGGPQPNYGAGARFGNTPPRPRKGADRIASTSITFRESLKGATLTMKVDGKKNTVRIPAGIKEGQKVRLRGKGMPGENGGQSGDLQVTIHVEPHPVFTRDGDNLRVRVPVTFAEAALGTKIDVPLIDGNTVTVKVPAGTQSGAVLRVRKRGVETGKHTGDLLIEIMVAVPDHLTKEQKEAVKALADSFDYQDVRATLMEKAKE